MYEQSLYARVAPRDINDGMHGAVSAIIDLTRDPMLHVFPEVAAGRLIKKASGARLACPSDEVLIDCLPELVVIELRGARSMTISVNGLELLGPIAWVMHASR